MQPHMHTRWGSKRQDVSRKECTLRRKWTIIHRLPANVYVLRSQSTIHDLYTQVLGSPASASVMVIGHSLEGRGRDLALHKQDQCHQCMLRQRPVE